MKSLLAGVMLITATTLTGCVTFPTDESEQVDVIWDDTAALQGCEHKGTVIGSEGHFYDYWLHADKDMVWGTLNQMRIKAAEQGADTLYLYQPLGFLSSMTMFGNAYDCSVKNSVVAEKIQAETTQALTVSTSN
ncbi:DUF4156 domain-containing protein [Vibrio sinensis]|uniref:DUF4156 domain-containing protein n=1 Tax=Vibrio sinensis TaxID=2302434 RepID=A0A3A6QR54_9VIBR|nr:DUF4156 domain-containing protein [Vibrio sinensis]RJX75245.1 DUF4156 domain-containing protein [Vibrio sinensis]